MLQRPCPAEADNRVDYKGLGYDGRRHGQDQNGERGTFSEIASGHGVKIRVPVQFFDAAFRAEESPDAGSAIKELSDLSFFTKRVPQPYSQQRGTDSTPGGGRDLLTDLRDEIISFNRVAGFHSRLAKRAPFTAFLAPQGRIK